MQRFPARGDARILNITVFERWKRLFIYVNYVVRVLSPRTVARPSARAGVDLGLRTLANVSDTDGNIIEFLNPASLRATLSERHKVVQ